MSDVTEDVVARLRDANVNADCGGVVRGCCQGHLMLEAADEIERLRGIAQQLLSAFPTAQTRDQERVWQEAYDALQEKADG